MHYHHYILITKKNYHVFYLQCIYKNTYSRVSKNEAIYSLLEKFYLILKDDNWIKNYIFWELDLFKSIGYDLDFNNVVDEKIIGNKKKYISKSLNEKKIVPNFLVEKGQSSEDIKTLLSGLKIVTDYLEKSILKPNNLNQPISRLQFINTLK